MLIWLTRRTFVVIPLAVLILFIPVRAHADLERGQQDKDADTGADSDGGGGFGAGVGRDPRDVPISFSPEAESSEGALTSAVWSPPACYYAPSRTAVEMRDWWEGLNQPGWPGEDQRETESVKDDFLGDFPDYNVDQQGEGMFWQVVRNRDYPLDEQMACGDDTFWVDFDDPLPEREHIADVEVLAALAWEETRVPDPELSLSPVDPGGQVVGLPMWVWQEGAGVEPVSVRAELDDYGVWAETTATPVSLELDPGTGDAGVFPSSGVCRLEGGSFGEPYGAADEGAEPPCGVVYERASHGAGSFTLAATVTWEVTWRDYADDEPRELAEGLVETSEEITVQEVQAIVR